MPVCFSLTQKSELVVIHNLTGKYQTIQLHTHLMKVSPIILMRGEINVFCVDYLLRLMDPERERMVFWKETKKQFSVSFQNIENASDPDSTIALHKIRIPDKNIFALGHPDCTSPEDLKQINNSYNIANYWTKVSKGTIYRLNFSAREIHRLYNHISVYGKVLYENTRGQFIRCETANTCTRHCLYHHCLYHEDKTP